MDGLLDLYLFAGFMEAYRRLNQNIERRRIRDVSNPFELPDQKFKKLFRLSKGLVRRFIEELRPFLAAAQRRTTEIKVFATLLFLTQGQHNQTCVGDNFNLGLCQKSVYVVFPQTQQIRDRVKIGFMEKFNFPGVICAIDCTHIAIVAPATEDDVHPGIAYYNRKGFYSFNVQLICDSNLNILNINARFPGSNHDAAIWDLSSVRRHLDQEYFLRGLRSSWLIGDSGYGLQTWLLTPIVDAEENTPEGRYTRGHILARNSIERCIGLLKQRFRCLLHHRVLHYDPVRAGKIIYTSAVLHNLANAEGIEPLDPDEEDVIENGIEIDANNVQQNQDLLHQGRRVRNTLIEQHFQ